MLRFRAFCTVSAALAPALAHAQGSDACGSAQVIQGSGSFAFDTTFATTDGVPSALCYSAGYNQIERDVWFAWTPGASGVYRFETCSQTAVDTWIALLDAPCSGAALGCNDDACGFQSSMDVPVSAGTTYYLRIGVFPGKSGGPGNVLITQVGPPTVLHTVTHPTTGHVYKVLSPCTWKEAELIAQASFNAHLVTIEGFSEVQYISLNIKPLIGSNAQFWIGLNDAAVEGTFVWSSASTSSYTNWDAGEPNNASATEDYVHIRTNAKWNDAPLGSSSYNLPVYGLIEIGCNAPTNYCTVGTSSAGCAAAISASGTPSASASSGFQVRVDQVEGQKTGLIFYGTAGRTALAWGTGSSFLCIKAPTQRTPAHSSAGSAGACDGSLLLDWNAFRAANPGALGQPFAFGDTVQVQGWFRDPPSAKHTHMSDALEFIVCP